MGLIRVSAGSGSQRVRGRVATRARLQSGRSCARSALPLPASEPGVSSGGPLEPRACGPDSGPCGVHARRRTYGPNRCGALGLRVGSGRRHPLRQGRPPPRRGRGALGRGGGAGGGGAAPQRAVPGPPQDRMRLSQRADHPHWTPGYQHTCVYSARVRAVLRLPQAEHPEPGA